MNQIKINHDQYEKLISSLCCDIARDEWTPDYIVGVGRGGAAAAVMISHYFNINCFVLNISLTQDPPIVESNCWMADDAYGIEGKALNILVVDDINDQGRTLNWIIDDWRKSCMPHDKKWEEIWGDNVRFAVVVDNLSSEFSQKISYSGMTINKAEDPSWIVFPYENWWK